MKYSFKYRLLLAYWRVFDKEKYKISRKFQRAFENLDQETKDLLVRAALKGV